VCEEPHARIPAGYGIIVGKVSFIIPVYGKWELAANAVYSIRATCGSEPEIVLVDDGSVERPPGLAPVNVYLRQPNGGFARACNAGAKVASGDFLAFINSDAELQPGFLDTLLPEFDVATVGCVGPRLTFPTGKLQCGGVVFSKLVGQGQHTFHGADPDAPDTKLQRLTDVAAICGAAFIIRRTAWEQVGDFDEGFRNALEDMDWSIRAYDRGWDFVYNPAANVIHHEKATRGEEANPAVVRNKAYWWLRHPKSFVYSDEELVLLDRGLRGSVNMNFEKGEFGIGYTADVSDPRWQNVREYQRALRRTRRGEQVTIALDPSALPEEIGCFLWGAQIACAFQMDPSPYIIPILQSQNGFLVLQHLQNLWYDRFSWDIIRAVLDVTASRARMQMESELLDMGIDPSKEWHGLSIDASPSDFEPAVSV